MKKFIEDFKAFALKGNIIDMAIGVVIGGAFGKIVTALVEKIINPVIGLLTNNISLSELKYVLVEEIVEAETVIQPELAIGYGAFIQTIIDFLIIALSIFVIMRVAMNAHKKLDALKKKEEEAVAEAEEEEKDTELSVLLEIRELLKDKE